MKSIILFNFLFIFWVIVGTAQSDSVSDDLSFYSDIVANADLHSSKIRANDSLVVLVEKVLENNQSKKLSNHKWISEVAPDDGTFKIFSWQTQVSDSAFIYNAYISYENGSYVALQDKASKLYDDYEYMAGNKDNWFGQLYYNIIPFKLDEETCYLLFGYNGWNQFENIKIAEVLSFDENGNPTFGQPLFVKEGQVERDAKQRIMLQYSDSSPVNLNYNPGLEMVVFDHLISRMGTIPGQGPTSVSDGSYEGYKFEKGKWQHVEKLYDHIYEEAPRPTPVLDSKEKNIFGEGKKIKN